MTKKPKDNRKRIRVQVEFSADELAAIDRGRGKSTRGAFCRNRVVLADGFGDPITDSCARVIGMATMLQDKRWEQVFAVEKLHQEVRDLVRLLKAGSATAQPQFLGHLARLEQHTSGLYALAAARVMLANQVVDLAAELAQHTAAQTGSIGRTNWDQKKR